MEAAVRVREPLVRPEISGDGRIGTALPGEVEDPAGRQGTIPERSGRLDVTRGWKNDALGPS